ncbi:MAG: hypothetical protein COA99_17335 [Moraxellaceae bacterium]|nr:MAG: hypothetical protein COA99_17335 [Moraxellaceae bacterium]
MNNISVAVDFSTCTPSIVDHALTLAKAIDSKIHLVHVVGANVDTKGRFRLGTEEEFPEAKDELRQLVNYLHDAGVEADSAVVEGSPALSIVHEAEHADSDFILMGTHGHSLVGGALMGSASQGVLRQSSIPVYFVPVKD